ncbi:proline-rich receptor-like protein kinase PERK2 [Calypte anna]|uniref:proline-rich receptor-like protein kinase PERK2 n=1 Tax=Calypte anna TaxID=9244 RepID=UPI0011C40C7E|nr:proline-rich receptor-like protein kinase PERK2 [Calypte anna]
MAAGAEGPGHHRLGNPAPPSPCHPGSQPLVTSAPPLTLSPRLPTPVTSAPPSPCHLGSQPLSPRLPTPLTSASDPLSPRLHPHPVTSAPPSPCYLGSTLTLLSRLPTLSPRLHPHPLSPRFPTVVTGLPAASPCPS